MQGLLNKGNKMEMIHEKSNDSIWKLLDIVEYNENSPSGLVWKCDTKRRGIGEVAGYFSKTDRVIYWRVSRKNKIFLAHRVIWMIHFGDIPQNMVIDHIDQDSMNNRIENLRCVTPDINTKNARKYKNNTTGFPGIFFVTSKTYLYVRASVGGKNGISKNFSAHKHGLMPSVYMANMWRKSHIDDKEGVGKDYSAKHMTTVSISNTDSNQSFQCRLSPSPLNESTRVGECSGDTEVATEGDKGLNGCYVGCYYYTDSCFRKDCKQ